MDLQLPLAQIEVLICNKQETEIKINNKQQEVQQFSEVSSLVLSPFLHFSCLITAVKMLSDHTQQPPKHHC